MSELKEGVNKKGFDEVVRNVIRYGECCKNHGVVQETNIADGCTEFMAAGDSLFCDACGCHRSFHKKKVVMEEGDAHDGSFSSSPTTTNTNTSVSAIYEACCKNQSMKSYPTKDGCLEFLPREGAEAGSRAALRCDACNCHRNFHKRREQEQQAVRKRSSYTRYDSDDYCYD